VSEDVKDITKSQRSKKQNKHIYQAIMKKIPPELIYGTRNAITST